MRRFMKVVVPTDGYEEVKKIGSKWLIHLEGTPTGEPSDALVECYECVVDEEPDLEVLGEELQEWKTFIAGKELGNAKQTRIAELTVYDKSGAVDSFELRRDGQKIIDYWINRDLRPSLEGDVKAAKEVGDTYDFDIRELGITLTLDCDKFLAALSVLKRYAYTCFNVTSRHMAAINALQTVEDVRGYDFTIGYPPKLVFNIEELV